MENVKELNDQEQVRRDKLEKYKELGVDPFGQAYKVSHHVQDIRILCAKKDSQKLDKLQLIVSIAGRIMSIRRMGKASFMNIQDSTGHMQVYMGIDVVGKKAYELFKLADIGDIVGVKGRVMMTKTGELTIRASKYTHLTKCLHPLAEKYHGLTDIEERSRRRYLDLIMNEDSKKIAFTRPKIVRSIQHFLDNQGFTEVETSILSPILGGASARPFITHHNALDKNFYLRIATELNLKRLIVGGMERVYEIGRLFRNEGVDATHNPEFTSIEIYQAYSDLKGIGALTEKMIRNVAKEVTGSAIVKYGDKEIDFKSPFKWISMHDLILQKTGIDFDNINTFEEAKAIAEEKGIHIDNFKNTIGYVMNEIYEELCQDDLIQPTFVYEYPIEVSPLTKKGKDPRFVERFELFVNGKELANAYSELNDPLDQKERFLAQLKAKELGDEEASEMDDDFIEALEYGMAPTGGVGMGIDRLVMLLTNQTQIREVILFPTMKDANKKISTAKPALNNITIANSNSVTVEENIDFTKVEIEPLFADYVDFETFSKNDFRAVKVLACEAVAKSKKLLKFTLDDGTDINRIILSGIHAYYEPEELIGKTLIAITNLPPRAMMGIESCGMLLSATHKDNGEDRLHLLMVDSQIPAGAKLY